MTIKEFALYVVLSKGLNANQAGLSICFNIGYSAGWHVRATGIYFALVRNPCFTWPFTGELSAFFHFVGEFSVLMRLFLSMYR
jgi:hypothetical protein